jgi:hypothetical protein
MKKIDFFEVYCSCCSECRHVEKSLSCEATDKRRKDEEKKMVEKFSLVD